MRVTVTDKLRHQNVRPLSGLRLSAATVARRCPADGLTWRFRSGLAEFGWRDEQSGLDPQLPDGWQRWLEWQRTTAPGNLAEIATLEADAGQYLGYLRVVGRRRPHIELVELPISLPADYQSAPLLRDN